MDVDLVNSGGSEDEGFFFGWWVVGAAFLITAVTVGVFYSYGVFFLPVMAEFGWSRTALSGVALAGGLTYAATVPLAGWLADRYGFRPVTAVTAATLGLGFVLCSLVKSVWELYLFAGFVCGLGSPIGIALPLSMVARWFVKRQGLALGIASAGIGAGAATVPLLATCLISALGWRASYALLGLLIWVTCIPVALITMRDPAPDDVRAREKRPAALKNPFGSCLAESSLSLSQAVQTSSFWYLFSIFGLSIFCLGLAMTHLVPHARDTGLSAVTAAGLLSAMGAFSIVGRLVSGMISDRIGARLVLAAGVFIQGVMMLWLAKADSTWAFYLFAAIFGLSYGGNIVLIPKLTSHIFGVGSMGAIFGALSVADGLGFGTGPLMAGYIFDMTGSYQMSFLIVAAAMAVALAATLAMREERAPDARKGNIQRETGGAMTKAIQDSQSNVLRLTDILPGLLAVSWRLPSMVLTMKRLLSFKNDKRMSMGSALEHNAEVHADRTAILYENVKYTHREFNESMNRYAHYFLSQGVQEGDEVVVFVDNRPELLMMIGAMSKLGAISSLVNPNQRGEVLKYSINLARGRHFIVGEELIDAFEEIKDGLKLTEKDALYYQPEAGQRPCPAGYVDLPDVLKVQSSNNPTTTGHVTLGDPFAYVFTSGTTGLPKASVQTHRRWFAAQYWFGKIVMNLKPKDVHYCPLPFCHTNALNVSWSAAAGGGAALAIRRKFSASNFLSDVRRFNANSFIYIGEICRYLMNQPQRSDDADNPLVACMGNGLRPDIWKAFKKRFGIKKVFELYGAAEGPLIFTNLLNVDCTVGMCLTPYAIIKYDVDTNEPVRDENGFMQRVQKGEVGLMVAEINESLPFVGYTDKKETEKKIFRDVFAKGDSWFNFGDLVLDQGFKHILFVDRIGDTFRWKGENVSTGEVEKVLNTHHHVAESTAYGVKIPGTDGRAGMAAIIPATTVDLFDMKALGEIVVKGLPHYAVPRFIRFMKAFETTATHKIKKTALRDEAFDPAKVSDPLYVILPGTDTYVPLTKELCQEIVGGKHRF